MLHAAAITGGDTADFDRWCSGPALAAEAVSILRDHPRAVPGWADKLDEIITADPRTRDNTGAGVTQATRALSNPTVLAACSPGPTELFDVERFLTESGTLYIVGDGPTRRLDRRRAHRGPVRHGHEDREPVVRASARPTAAAGPRRSRQHRLSPVAAHHGVRRRWPRNHDGQRAAIPSAGTRPVGRRRRTRHLGGLNHQDRARRRQRHPRPTRPVHPRRHPRRTNQLAQLRRGWVALGIPILARSADHAPNRSHPCPRASAAWR